MIEPGTALDFREWMFDGIQDALDSGGGSHNVDHVLAALLRGEAQLWTAENACLITEVVDGPLRRELHFWVATGRLDNVIELSRRVMEWGREQGCAVATLTGRRGWVKALRDEGWREVSVMMGRRLDGQGQEADYHDDA